MSQEETVRARNNLILSTVLLNLVVLFIVVALLVNKLGFDFGDEEGALTKETADLLIKPVGIVSVAGVDAAPVAPVAAPPAKSPAEMTKTDKALALIKEKGYACTGCHQVDAKVVGPAYQEVAAKYKGDAKAADMLATKIKAGGAGTWGEVAMPPNATVTDEDMKVLVDWILTLEPASAAKAEETAAPTEDAKPEAAMSATDSMATEKKQLATDAPVAEEKPADSMSTETKTEEDTAKEGSAETTGSKGSATVMTTDDAMMFIADKGYACLACHQVDTKMVGPGYKEISAKYKGDATASEKLIAKIKNGGAGSWGEIPMPPNPTVTDDDAKALVTWILSLQ